MSDEKKIPYEECENGSTLDIKSFFLKKRKGNVEGAQN